MLAPQSLVMVLPLNCFMSYIELNQWFLIQILLAAFLSNAFSLMFYHVLINITLLLTVSVSDIQLTLYLLAAQRHPLKCNNEM